MELKLVEFSTAKLAKEVGFDIVVDRVYGNQNIPQLETYNETRYHLYNDYILAPTQALLQMWLREIHKIDITIYNIIVNNVLYYKLKIEEWGRTHKQWINRDYAGKFKTYEEALERGLLIGLDILQEKQNRDSKKNSNTN